MSENPSDSGTDSKAGGETGPEPGTDAFTEEVLAVLELIRPAVKEDGGDIELVSTSSEGEVHIRFLGACIGCPSSEITLRDGIARHLRDRISTVTAVIAVD